MLYIIIILLVLLLIVSVKIIHNMWAMMNGQIIATKNQKYISNQLDTMQASINVIESLYKGLKKGN